MAGWTQTPNFIYDLMPEMSEAEIKVVLVIVRQTIGWQREAISLSVSELESLTKMARASVVSGLKSALEHGILARQEDGKSYIYSIVEPVESVPSVQILNRCEEESVQNLNSKEPESVQNLDRQSVQILNHNKRYINTKKLPEGKKEIAANAAPPLPPTTEPSKPKRTRTPKSPPNTSGAPPQREPPEWQVFVGALCWLCHGHKELATLTKEQRGALLSEAKEIQALDFTKDDLREWYKRIWPQSWQWKKDKSRPKPADVRSSIAQLRAETPEGFEVSAPANGKHVNGTSKVAGSLAAMADYEEMKARLGVST
jgi:phage replication O-like protein O